MQSSASTDLVWSGTRQGLAKATWGQQTMWQVHHSMPNARHLNQGGVVEVPEGLELEDVLNGLQHLLELHESLRTSLFQRGGSLWQALHGCGRMSVGVLDVEDDPDEQHPPELRQTLFDVAGERLVRFRVITVGDVPSRVEWSACHAICDGISADIVTSDLRDVLGSTGRTVAPQHGIQPLDLAAFEQSALGRTINDRAQRHWRTALESFPAYPRSSTATTPRFRSGRLRSPAAKTSAETVSRNLRISTSAVVLTAVCVALERVTRSKQVGLQLTSGNRFHPDLVRAVGNLTQTGVLVHEVTGTAFSKLAPEIAVASIRAYANARYDFAAVQRLIGQATARVKGLDVEVIFDDMRLAQAAVHPMDVSRSDSDELSAGSTFTWMPSVEYENTSLIIFLYGAPNAYVLDVQFNDGVFSEDVIEGLMWLIEDIIRQEATAGQH